MGKVELRTSIFSAAGAPSRAGQRTEEKRKWRRKDFEKIDSAPGAGRACEPFGPQDPEVCRPCLKRRFPNRSGLAQRARRRIARGRIVAAMPPGTRVDRKWRRKALKILIPRPQVAGS